MTEGRKRKKEEKSSEEEETHKRRRRVIQEGKESQEQKCSLFYLLFNLCLCSTFYRFTWSDHLLTFGSQHRQGQSGWWPQKRMLLRWPPGAASFGRRSRNYCCPCPWHPHPFPHSFTCSRVETLLTVCWGKPAVIQERDEKRENIWVIWEIRRYAAEWGEKRRVSAFVHSLLLGFCHCLFLTYRFLFLTH